MQRRRRVLLLALAIPPLLIAVALAGLLGTTVGTRWLLSQAELRLPLRLQSVDGSLWRGIRVDSLDWSDSGLRLHMDDLELVPRWTLNCLRSRQICLDTVHARYLGLKQLPTDVDAAAESGFSGLPEVDLPLGLRVDSLRIETLSWSAVGEVAAQADTAGLVLSDFATRLNITRDALQLEAFELTHPELRLSEAAATLRWRERWPVRLNLQAEVEDALLPDGLPQHWVLALRGDFDELRLHLDSPDGDAPSLSGRIMPARDFQALDADFELRGLDHSAAMQNLRPWLQLDGPLGLSLELALDPAAALPSGHLQLDSRLLGYADQALALHGELSFSDEDWRLDDFRLEDSRGRQRLQLAGALGRPGNWRPQLNLALAELSLPAEAPVPLSALSGSAYLAAAGSDLARSWEIAPEALSALWNDQPLRLSGRLQAASDSALLPIGSMDLQFRDQRLRYVREAAGAEPALLQAEGLQELAGLKVERLQATASIHGDALQLHVDSAGDLAAKMQLTLQRSAFESALTVAPFKGTLYGQTLELDQALVLQRRAASESLLLQPFCLRLRSASACTEGGSLAGDSALDFALRGEEHWSGEVSGRPMELFLRSAGDLALQWREGAFVRADLDLRLPLLRIDTPPFSAEDTPARWEDLRLLGIFTPDRQEVRLSASAATLGSLNLDLQYAEAQLDGHLQIADFAISALDPLFADIELAAGRVSSDLRLSGSLESPQLAGTLALDAASLRVPAQNLAIEALQLRVEGSAPENLSVEGRGQFAEAPLQLSGQCCTARTLQLRVKGERNRLDLPSGLGATLSPDLQIAFGPEALRIDGTVTVHEGAFAYRGLTSGGIARSPDVLRADEETEDASLGFAADVRTLIEPGFTLRTPQLESTVGGDLRLRSVPGEPPQLFGDLRVLGGELRLLGQALRLERGAVGFVGDPVNPDLRLSAIRDFSSEQLRVGARVSGALEAPQLEFFSEPPRSERETLSWLLRGRAPDAGAGDGADSTAVALSLGASALNRSAVVQSLEDLSWLSGVSLGAEGSEENTSATISGYVGNRLFLSYGMGIYQPVNTLVARLYLRSRLWLEVVSRLERSFDLYYRFDRP